MFINKDYTLIIALYINNLLILLKRIKEIAPLKTRLTERFKIKDLREVKVILSIRIT